MYGHTQVGNTTKRSGQYTAFVVFADGTESPLFDSLAELYPWMRQNGVVRDEYGTTPNGDAGTFYPWRVRKLYNTVLV